MQHYNIKFSWPQDFFVSVLLFAVSIYLLLISFSFFKNIKTGATLIVYGRRINFFTIKPGRYSAEQISDFESNSWGIVWGSAFLTPGKLIFFSVLSFMVALLTFVAIFTELIAI